MKLDAVDKQLLDLLQANADTPIAELAAQVHLPGTPCWRRIQRMKAEGVIRRTKQSRHSARRPSPQVEAAPE